MAYSLLGKVVWRLGRRWLRRRHPDLGRRLRTGALAAVLLGGGAAIAAAQRRSAARH